MCELDEAVQSKLSSYKMVMVKVMATCDVDQVLNLKRRKRKTKTEKFKAKV